MKRQHLKLLVAAGILPALAIGASVLPRGPWNPERDARKLAALNGGTNTLEVNRSCDVPLPPGQSIAASPEKADATAADVNFIGVVGQNNTWDPPSISGFSLGSTSDITNYLLPEDENDYTWSLTRGGFYTPDGYYYALDANNIYKFNINDWDSRIVSQVALDQSVGFPVATTYDATTGKVYGCFIDKRYMSPNSYSVASLDISTGQVTLLKSLPGGENGKAYGIAADPKGNLYIILKYDTNNTASFYPALYKVDKTTGNLTYIGSTNTNLQANFTSAAFDHSTGKLYWVLDALYNKCSVYEVDTATATCTKVYDIPNGSMFCSVAIPYTATPADAPALLTDLAVKFTDGNGNGNVTFTVPTETYSGSTLTGTVSYSIKCGDAELASGTAQAGAAVSKAVAIAARGEVTVSVTLDSNGSKSVSEIKTWSGNDVPAMPTEAVGTASGNDISLSWKASEIGVHGGYVDPSALTYKVVLQPEGKVLETAVSGTTLNKTLSLTEPKSVYAEIIPSANGEVGTAAVTAPFIAGPAFKLPYFQSFSDADCFGLYTVVDVAGDNATWAWYDGGDEAYAYCDYSAENPKDDWLFTPALHLEAGVQYTLSFKASSLMRNAFSEILEVKMGNAPTPAAMNVTLLESEKIDNDAPWSWYYYTIGLTVETAGDYNIGFHAMSAADQFKLALDDVRVEGSPFEGPLPVSEVTVIPAPWGVHNATLRFRLPTEANNGEAITSLVNAEVYVNNRLYKTIENPAPGSFQSITLETEEGANSIDIYTSNAAGRSIAARTSVYTGADSPGVATNFLGRVEGNTIHLTWDAPQSEHGGVLDTENLNFAIGRSVNYGETEVLSISLGNVYEYTDTYEADSQTPIIYFLAALNELGGGKSAISNCVIVGGDSYTLPFAETFASGFTSYNIWESQVVDNSGTAYWRMWNSEIDTRVTPYDSDFGAICFQPGKAGEKARLFSGCIDLTTARHPVLEFWYRGNGSAGQKLVIEGNAAQQKWEELAEITLTGESDTWTKVKVSLNRYNYVDRFQFAFRGEAANTSNIYVDNIVLREVYDNDLTVSLGTRKNFYMGESQNLNAEVTNCGENTSGAYKVEFYADDRLLGTVDMPALGVDETATATLKHEIDLGYDDNSTLMARVVWDADDNRYNNESTADVRNHLPLYPAPKSLTATGNAGAYSFNWAEPNAWVEPAATPVTDDFESYEPFLIDEIGDWTTVDVDGEDGTFGIIGLHFPHREAAKSWQLFNLWALGIEMADDEVTWRPSSGHQFLVAFADKDRRNDDWLISPVLTGDAQTISFMTRSLNTFWYGEEAFEVYASKTGKELSDFQLVYSGTAPGEWTKTSVDLPEGTMYFAIKCVSEGYKFAMGLDDITYIPGTGMPRDFELTGYNFYQNRKKVNDKALSELSYSHAGAATDSYAVTAVYTTGESRFSNVVNPSGVCNLTLADGVTVSVNGHDIVIEGADGKQLAIYTTDGVTRYAATGTDAPAVYTAQPGVYLVRVANATVKVIVR